MTATLTRWSLGTKMALVALPFLLLVLLTTLTSLWVTLQLDGGAAAVNEAGRMRMQYYRMALSIARGDHAALQAQALEFEASLALLRRGDRARPLLVPWDDTVEHHFATVEQDWQRFTAHWFDAPLSDVDTLPIQTARMTTDLDTMVRGIEGHLSRWTTALHWLQMGALFLSLVWTGVLLHAGHRLVLRPLGRLKQAVADIQSGNLDTRVHALTTDEFGTLTLGFNAMAEHLQGMYRDLENKVMEKTAQLQEKNERLESLYAITALVAEATSQENLARSFATTLQGIARADGVAIRWCDPKQQHYLMMASSGLPSTMVEEERCLQAGDCYCGMSAPGTGLAVIPIHALPGPSLKRCVKAGFGTIVNIPIRLHERLMGEVSLFFQAKVSPGAAERSLLEALASQLASGMEHLRLSVLEREAAVSGERHHLSRELHDSIAQSLAFLKIQVQLLRDAMKSGNGEEVQIVLEEIDTGVRECYGDVRELLMHFRTRANTEDIEPALASMLRKFEHQSGTKTTLDITGHALPLGADLQIQILHILQEALSNVRKHARASQVCLSVQRQPQWRFEICDDGIGFTPHAGALPETHLGLRIMAERAQRIHATLEVNSAPHKGCSVVLRLPLSPALDHTATPAL